LVFEVQRRSIGPLIESGLCWLRLSFELGHTISTVRDSRL
jgi:hypothetical protein